MPGNIGVIHESGLSAKFKWEISNFSSLSFTGLNDCYISDFFSFESADYRLYIYGASLRSHCHSVYLRNENGISSYVTCSLSILDTNCTYFITETAGLTSNHWFKNFINMSVLKQRESQLLPSGTLTIVCILERGLRLNRRGDMVANSFYNKETVDDMTQKLRAEIKRIDTMLATKKARRASTFDFPNRPAVDVSGAASQSTYFRCLGVQSSLLGASASSTTASSTISTAYKVCSTSTFDLSTQNVGSICDAVSQKTAFDVIRKPSSKLGAHVSSSTCKFRVCSYCGVKVDAKISWHETKCMYRPIKCPKCSTFILFENWINHKCQNASIEDKACTTVSANNFSGNKILRDYRELFLKQKDCDVIVKVKEQQFPVHRAIVRARSSIFESTLRSGDTKKKITHIINIEDCDPAIFSVFLSFLYWGDTDTITDTNVFSLFKTADKYNVQDLRETCMKFMKENLSVDTFCETLSVAFQFSETELINLAINFFSKNLQTIIVTAQWQSLFVENPKLSNELLIKVLVPDKNFAK